MPRDIEKEIFNVNAAHFNALALKVFLFQYHHCTIYRQFCDALNVTPVQVTTVEQIPFLPIQFFKSHSISSGVFSPEMLFESSGTTGAVNSRHSVKSLALYKESFLKAFQLFYGNAEAYCIIGLLPSYLERGHSSLVYMVNELVKLSGHENSGFYLYDHKRLHQTLLSNEAKSTPTLLIGVSYALLDFTQEYPIALKNTILMETGGMKGRRREMTREELHAQLQKQTGLALIHSEYGMTELLSQAYSSGQGLFNCPPWMKVLIRAEDDPLYVTGPENGKTATGVVNIIDLANLYSCSFIATDDVGKLHSKGSFEVMGRLDQSDIRGCGLMFL
jgi:Acyl-protein synthetase, LuxE